MTAQEMWLAERRKAITGTDLGKLFGTAGGAGPMQVYLDKLGLSEPFAGNERTDWGLRLQRAILEAYADREGVGISFADPHEFVRDPVEPLLGASLDGRRLDNGCPVDAKNVGFKHAAWGDDGSDQVPDGVQLQMQLQMAVTRSDRAYVAALFGGNKLHVYELRRNDELIALIRREARRFWDEHIATGVPPPVDGSPAWSGFLKRTRQTSNEVLDCPPELEPVGAELIRVRDQLGALEGEEATLVQKLQLFIGEHAGVKGRGWKATWREGGAIGRTDWRSVAQDAIAQLLVEHPERKQLIEGIIEAHTKASPGVRRFVLTQQEE